MISGGLFLQGIIDTAINLSTPVYFYVYNHVNEFSFNQYFGPYTNNLGVTHSDELTSLFYFDNYEKLSDADIEVSKLMLNIWTRFARDEYVHKYHYHIFK